jgi:hypothetical protein
MMHSGNPLTLPGACGAAPSVRSTGRERLFAPSGRRYADTHLTLMHSLTASCLSQAEIEHRYGQLSQQAYRSHCLCAHIVTRRLPHHPEVHRCKPPARSPYLQNTTRYCSGHLLCVAQVTTQWAHIHFCPLVVSPDCLPRLWLRPPQAHRVELHHTAENPSAICQVRQAELAKSPAHVYK